MTVAPSYVLDPGVSLHEQRTARLEEALLGNNVNNAGAGDNIYMIDNRVSMKAPHPPLPSLPKAPVMCDVSQDENEKLYETISLHSLGKEDTAEESMIKGSISTPLLALVQEGQSVTPKCKEAMSPIYLSLEPESVKKSTSIAEA